jgi:hypothetical protein
LETHLCGRSKKLLKIGSTSPSINQEPISLLTLPAERQKKTVNPKLKAYESSHRVEELTLGIPHESTFPGPSELAACGITIGLFFPKTNPGHVQVLKSRNKETEFFYLWKYFLNKVVARQTINAE